MTVTVRIEGADDLARRLRVAGARAMPICAGAVREIGEEIMGASISQAPIDTGNLRSEGKVYGPDISPGRATVTLAYGGAAEAYALAVHEHPSQHSPRSWAGGVTFRFGKTHFLSDPVKARQTRFGADIGRRIRVRLEHALAR